jgi:ribosomal protein L22
MFSGSLAIRKLLQTQCRAMTTATPSFTVKVNSVAPQTSLQLIDEKLAKIQTPPECYFPAEHIQPPNPTWIAKKLDIPYSSIKLMAVANLITGKHIYDAIATLNGVDKKGGPIVESVLFAAKKNGQNKGFNEERMFVKTSIVGKGISHKKVDIKGRGKMGMITVPKCSLVITLEERSATDYYKMIMKGETPAGIAATYRRLLY